MENDLHDNESDEKDQTSVSADEVEMIQGLLDFSGDKILDKIMEWDNPKQLVRQIPGEDFF